MIVSNILQLLYGKVSPFSRRIDNITYSEFFLSYYTVLVEIVVGLLDCIYDSVKKVSPIVACIVYVRKESITNPLENSPISIHSSGGE